MSSLVLACALVAATWLAAKVYEGALNPGRNQMLESISLSGRTISLKPVLWKESHHLKNSQNYRFRKSMFLVTKYEACGSYCFTGGFPESLQIFKAAVLECPGRAQWLFQVCFIFYTPGTFQMLYVIYKVVDFLWKAVDCFYFILLPTLDCIDCGTIVYEFHSCKEFCQLENLSWSSNNPRAVKHL